MLYNPKNKSNFKKRSFFPLSFLNTPPCSIRWSEKLHQFPLHIKAVREKNTDKGKQEKLNIQILKHVKMKE